MDCNKLNAMREKNQQIISHCRNRSKSNRTIVETETKSIPLTHIYRTADFPTWLGTGTSIKSVGVKLIQSNKISFDVSYQQRVQSTITSYI